MEVENQTHQAVVDRDQNKLTVYTESGAIAVERQEYKPSSLNNTEARGQLTAPMSATVVAIMKAVDDKIKTGDCLMVLEAMKMEHTIHAPADGILTDIFYAIGAQVNEGAQLVAMEFDKP